MGTRPVCVLAFSGGLDTSLCVVWLREELGYDIVTCTVDTGGFDDEELAFIETRSRELGAIAHHTVDGTGELFDDWIRHIIASNYQKGGVYPLCVGVERVVQARYLVEYARKYEATAVAHGSTGAGNDQIRFDVVLRTLGPEVGDGCAHGGLPGGLRPSAVERRRGTHRAWRSASAPPC